MKHLVVFFIAIIIAFSQGAPQETVSDFKCPQPYLSELKPITVNKFLGIWYFIRVGPCEENHDVSCMSTVIWRTKDLAENSVKSICSVKSNGTTEVEESNGTFKPSASEPGKADNHWTYNVMNTTVTSVFVASDEGQNWVLEHACFEWEGNVTSMWHVMSRHRYMDAKLEQDLVEKVAKYSGLTHDKIRGISQTDCYA